MRDGVRPLTPAQAQRLLQANRLLQDDQPEAALRIVRGLLETMPDAADAHHLHALCLDRAGDASEIEHAFRSALALAPHAVPVLVNYSKWLRRYGRGETLLPQLRQACGSAMPVSLGLQIGLTELDAGAWSRAIEVFEALLDQTPGLVAAWVGLGNAMRGAGDHDGALASFASALELDPQCVPAWVNSAAIHREHGRIESSLACLTRVDALGRMTPEIEDLYHGVLADAGYEQAALDGAKRLVTRAPAFVPGQVSLTHLLWEFASASDAEDPMARFTAAAQARPEDLALQMAYVRTLLDLRRGDSAIRFADALRVRFGDALPTLWLSADAAVLAGDTARAEVLFAKGLTLGGAGNPAFLNAYVRCLLRTGQWREAAGLAMRATRLDGGNQEGWALLGTAWRLLGDVREVWLCDYEAMVGFVEVDMPDGMDRETFLLRLSQALMPLHRATRAPANQSLREGSQTRGHLFGRDDPMIRVAGAALHQAASRWLAGRAHLADHPFLGLVRQPFVYSGSWSVRLRSSGRHANHIHPEGCLSSAFYVALPPSMETETGDDGCLQLGQPMRELGVSLPPRRILRPKPGYLALFPSYMWHGTVPFEDAVTRLTIAFDMQPEANARSPSLSPRGFRRP